MKNFKTPLVSLAEHRPRGRQRALKRGDVGQKATAMLAKYLQPDTVWTLSGGCLHYKQLAY